MNRKEPRNKNFFFSSFTCLFAGFSLSVSRGFPIVLGYLKLSLDIFVSFDFFGDV